MGLLGAVGSVVGGLIGAGSQANANQVNQAMSQEQMKFQKHMSDTAVQRRVADMRKAGINPLLSVSGASAGASTPAGASSTNQRTIDPAVMGQLLTSVSNARVAEAQKKKIESETVTQESNQLKSDLANAQLELQNKNLSSSERRALEKHVKELKHLNAQTGYINSQTAFNDSRHQAFNSDVANTPDGQKATYFKNMFGGSLGQILDDTMDATGDWLGDKARGKFGNKKSKGGYPTIDGIEAPNRSSDRARGKTSTSGWDKKPNKSGYNYKPFKGRSNARR